ncbi:hypothetical protein F3N42_11665 [Marinihelvus fidelis]|uniref:Uncharacterized protein n=1 Tax=Marinihelvus fidelis TaxID=2613842 RepID=A0A5N0TCJ5_9GAMM|nr:DUF6502 family protein [Marinihelvus fidelis]KAA9130999.1 hypothetical protein F3N42_11665 [Marinihelvus fidelis]
MRLTRRFEESEVAIIGRGVEAVLRRLVRFLAGRISLTKLHELIDTLYVEELEEKLRRDHPGRQITLAMMALNTGLDTRVINRIRTSPGYRRSLVGEAEFFRNFTPAASFLHLWSTDTRFTDAETGQPQPLAIEGGDASIEALVNTLKLPRGVTVKSVLDQLELSGLVEIDHDAGIVSMRIDRYLPSPDKDREGALEIGFVAVSRLIDTVLGNMDPALSDEDRLFQRVYWIYRLPPHRLAGLRESLVRVLERAEKEGYETLSEYDQDVEAANHIAAGFGLYLFEDSPSGASSK